MLIRTATPADLPQMISLIQAYRGRLATWAPDFWKKSDKAEDFTQMWFDHLLKQDNVLGLISEEEGAVNGFLIATLIDAPPVYDVPGKACMIDDYAILDDALWSTIGSALLDQAQTWARAQGAAQTIMVTPNDHTEKNTFAAAAGLKPTSTWWTATL